MRQKVSSTARWFFFRETYIQNLETNAAFAHENEEFQHKACLAN